MPTPGAFDDGIDALKLWLPTQLALDFFRCRDESRGIARTVLHDRDGNLESVLSLVLAQGLTLVAIGAGIGLVAAALLAFALSIDDFVITYLNAGATITFPLFIWGAARVAIPPQIYVIASMIFLFTLAMMLLTVWQQRRAERMAAVRPEP